MALEWPGDHFATPNASNGIVRNVVRWDSRLMISLEEGISLETAIPG